MSEKLWQQTGSRIMACGPSELCAHMDLLGTIVSGVNDAFLLLSREGVVLCANRAANDFLGLTSGCRVPEWASEKHEFGEAPVASPSRAFALHRPGVPRESAPPGLPSLERALFDAWRQEPDETTIQAFAPAKRESGERRNVRLRIWRLTESPGETPWALAVWLSTGGQEDTEALARLGCNMATLAHEFRNRLSGISSGLQYLRRSSLQNCEQEEAEETLDFLSGEIARMNRMLDDLLLSTGQSHLSLKEIDLGQIFEQCFQCLVSEMHAKRLVLETRLAHKPADIRGDRVRLEQVFLNILKNAVEASPAGGRIAVSTSTVMPHGILGEESQPNAEVVVTITDEGEGISEELMSSIFQPFFTTKGDGVGLGLYVTRSIVEEHQGEIRVRRHPDGEKGTAFEVVLPARLVQVETV